MKTIKVLFLVAGLLIFGISNKTNAQVRVLGGITNGSYNVMANDLKKLIDSKISQIQDSINIINKKILQLASQKQDTMLISQQKRKILLRLDHFKSISVEFTATKGSLDNIDKINKKAGVQHDLAFVQYDVVLFKQFEDLEGEKFSTENLRLVLPIGLEEIHVLARTDGNINTLADLFAKKEKEKKYVVSGSIGTGTRITADVMKSKIMNSVKKGDIFGWYDAPITFDNAMGKLISNQIDANLNGVIQVGAAPMDKLKKYQLSAGQKMKLVPVTNPELADAYVKTTIKAGTYKWADYDVPTYAVRTVIITNIAIDDVARQKKMEAFLSFLRDNLDWLKQHGHAVWKQVDLDFSGFPELETYEVSSKVFGK